MEAARATRRSWRRWAVAALLAAGVAVALLAPGIARRRRFVLYPEAEAAAATNPHAYRGAPLCQRCHPDRDARLAADPVALCSRCHDLRHASHPVDVIQKHPAEVSLPLGSGGRVVCHSCHDPHDLSRKPAGLRREFTALCLECHPGH